MVSPGWKCFCRQNARWDFTGIIILIRTVSRSKLIKMSSPSWSSKNDSYIDASCTMDFRNYRRHPSWVTISSSAFECLLACLDCLPCRRCGMDGTKVSILVRILLPFNNSLGDSPDAKEILAKLPLEVTRIFSMPV